MPAALVFGATGQLGRPLLARLRSSGWDVVAVSRDARQEPGVCWVEGALASLGAVPGRYDAVFSCGPLDHFARWYAAHGGGLPRVVAFGSTSVEVKQGSGDPRERDLAARLAKGEEVVFAAASRHGATATVLRPTLVYGGGGDRTLTRIAELARRWRLVPLPADATAVRQPVHVDDLAAAAIAVQGSTATHGRTYALPGGETLPYREMVARVVAALDPPARILPLPGPVFRGALALARAAGIAGGFGDAAVARLRDDLVFDATPARRDFGYGGSEQLSREDYKAERYRGIIEWALSHRKMTLGIAAGSFVAAFALFPFIGGAFMPHRESRERGISMAFIKAPLMVVAAATLGLTRSAVAKYGVK